MAEKVKMGNMDLIESCSKNNPVYQIFKSFWRNNSALELEKTPWQGKQSDNSLTFTSKEKDEMSIRKLLVEIFNLNSECKDFHEKFNQAVSGGGNEIRRILTLHSSSLLAFLSFYKVNANNPIDIQITANEKFTFDTVEFESKNPVTYRYRGSENPGNNPKSNVDIKLTGKNAHGEKVVLFLESKFSEYLKNGKATDIKDALYHDIYSESEMKYFLDDQGFEYVQNSKKPEDDMDLRSKTGNTKAYLGGIKQMISHFMGVCEYASDPKHANEEIYLGAILYKFDSQIDNKQSLANYSELYTDLMNALTDINRRYNQCPKVHLLPEVLTYQIIFKEQNKGFLDEKVAKFYKL